MLMAPSGQAHKFLLPSQPSGNGEVSELKIQLRQLAGSRAPGTNDSRRDLFKRVISCMTMGIDVSAAFSEMVMCSATSDVVLKKMCYLYIGNYACCHPDLALLTINFLLKDCRDEDPIIRGLALRSLCSLRVPNLVEYLVAPLDAGLKDGSAYVRKVAALGVLKLYHISAITFFNSDLLALLKRLVVDDLGTEVMANCLYALQEIWNLESNKSEGACGEREFLLIYPIEILYWKLDEFNEWEQCFVLELFSKYKPDSISRRNGMLMRFQLPLYHKNGAVRIAAIKALLHLTMSMTNEHQQVYENIKPHLFHLVSSKNSAQSYAILCHLHLLVMRAPMLFSSDYKRFYCKFSDPSYVKKRKLEILAAIANESNTYEIVTELCDYAGKVDVPPIARESIRAVGKIALQGYDVNVIADRLLQFLEMQKDYLTVETLVLMKDLLRKYPQWSHDCIAAVGNISSKNVQEPKAKAAFIWMLGEYSQDMADAPYILESLAENWEEENAAEVKLHLLTGAMRCFFKRPPETQKALGAALAAGLADSHQDVHDRALFYYRLLQYDVSVAERVVNLTKQAISVFADTQNNKVKDRMFYEFNSLSVVYQKPSYMFTDKEHRRPFEFLEEVGSLSLGQESMDNASGYSALHGYNSSLVSLSSQPQSETGTSEPALSNDACHTTFATDDLLGLSVPAAPAPPFLKLNTKAAALDPATFRRKWGQLGISISQECSVSPRGVPALTTAQALIRHMQGSSIQCIASGGQSPNFKFFFFAQMDDGSPSFFLAECIINTSSGKAQVNVKADDASASEAFFALFQSALSKFEGLL